MSALWVNINRNGALGNRLFSRAHVYAAAREFGAVVADWGLGDYKRLFPALPAAQLASYPLTAAGAVPELPDRWWLNEATLGFARRARPRRTGQHGPVWSCYWGGADPDTMALDGPAFAKFAAGRELLFLDGYKLRCTPWVRKHADEIRRFFALPQALTAKWAALQAQWHRQWPTTVAVHMRATDFRKAQGGRYYLSPAEYASVLKSSEAIDPAKTLFVLFSDESFRKDADFAALGSAFVGLDHVFMHGDLADDLAGIASCDRIVGPFTSTFSRWAAFADARPWAGVGRAMLSDDNVRLRFKHDLVPWDFAPSSAAGKEHHQIDPER
jgi:hypothetical protein